MTVGVFWREEPKACENQTEPEHQRDSQRNRHRQIQLFEEEHPRACQIKGHG